MTAMGMDSLSSSTSGDATPPDDEIEHFIETDPALVPIARSHLLVSASILEPDEVRALLDGFCLPEGLIVTACDMEMPAAADALADALAGDGEFKEFTDEPHPPPARCGRRNSKLSPLAWLFPHDAGAG